MAAVERAPRSPAEIRFDLEESGKIVAGCNAFFTAIKSKEFKVFDGLPPTEAIVAGERLSALGVKLKEQTLPHYQTRQVQAAEKLVTITERRATTHPELTPIFEHLKVQLEQLRAGGSPPRQTRKSMPPQETESEGASTTKIRVVATDERYLTVSVDGTEKTFRELPRQALLFFIMHPGQEFDTQSLRDGARLPKNKSPYDICVQVNNRLAREIITWRKEGSRDVYYYYLNAVVEPFEFPRPPKDTAPLDTDQPPPPPAAAEREGEKLPRIKVVRSDPLQTSVAIDGGKPVVFYGGDPLRTLLFLLRHPQENIPSKTLREGAGLAGSPSPVCNGLNERLDPENKNLITFGGPSRQDYHYRLNADVEPFELTESSTGNQQEKLAKVSADEMAVPIAVTTDQEAHLEPPSPHERATSSPPDGTVRHVAPAQRVPLRAPAAAPSTEGKPPPAPTKEQRHAQALQRAGLDLAYAVVNFISLNGIREIENMNSNPVDFLINATPDIAYLQPLLAGVSVPNPPFSLRESLVRSSMELVIRLWHNRHAGRSQKEHQIAGELTLIERTQRVELVGFLTATSKQLGVSVSPGEILEMIAQYDNAAARPSPARAS